MIAAITVTASLQFTQIPAVTLFSLDILDPDAAPLPQALSRVFDAAQEPRVVLEPIIEPIILGREADQHSSESEPPA